MQSITSQIHIDVPIEKIWTIARNLEEIPKYDTGYLTARYISENREGVGAKRYAEIDTPQGPRFVKHRVTEWREGEGFSWEAYETNAPLIKSAINRWSFSQDGDQTVISDELRYELKFGPLGALIDKLFMKKLLQGAVEGLLSGLKQYAETGQPLAR